MYLLGLLLSVVLYWYLGPWVFSVVCSPSLLCRSSMTASVAIFAALSSCCVTHLLSVYISNSRTMDDVRTHILIHRSFPCFATNITIQLSSITTYDHIHHVYAHAHALMPEMRFCYDTIFDDCDSLFTTIGYVYPVSHIYTHVSRLPVNIHSTSQSPDTTTLLEQEALRPTLHTHRPPRGRPWFASFLHQIWLSPSISSLPYANVRRCSHAGSISL